MLKLEYRLTKQDSIEASFANLRSRRVLYLFNWSVSVLALLSGIIILVAYAVNGKPPLLTGLYGVVLGVTLNPEQKINIFRRWLLEYIWRQNTNLRHSIAAEATEAGLTIASLHASSQMNWQLFSKFVETQNLFLVYQSPQILNIFPKRAFADAAQIEEFRSLLQTHIRPQSSRSF